MIGLKSSTLVALAIAAGQPEPAPPPAPAPAPAETAPAPQPEPQPAPQPKAAPLPPPPSSAPPPRAEDDDDDDDDDADDDDDDDDDDDWDGRDDKAKGNGLLIGAGATALVGAVFNALRISTVTFRCQTDSQAGCTQAWVAESVFAWGFNNTSIALAAAGGHFRGRRDATFQPEDHRRRRTGAIIAGATLLATGLIGNVFIRSAWLYDYTTPQGPELFDFASLGDSIAYYGGLQVSSWMIAAGAGALLYGAAKPRHRNVSVAPSPMGFAIQGRF